MGLSYTGGAVSSACSLQILRRRKAHAVDSGTPQAPVALRCLDSYSLLAHNGLVFLHGWNEREIGPAGRACQLCPLALMTLSLLMYEILVSRSAFLAPPLVREP
jgi:hypothetical protein